MGVGGRVGMDQLKREVLPPESRGQEKEGEGGEGGIKGADERPFPHVRLR